MLRIDKKIVSAALLIASLYAFSAAPDPAAPDPAAPPADPTTPPTAPPTPVDWRQKALRQAKEPQYFYDLLDTTEDAIRAGTSGLAAPDRTVFLNGRKQARVDAINTPTALTEEELTYVRTELEKATQFLNNEQQAFLYRELGHATYFFVAQAPTFLENIATAEPINRLKMVAQFLLSMQEGKNYEEAIEQAAKPALILNPGRPSKPADAVLAQALGDTLYKSIEDENKQALLTWITANPPADPANPTVPYLIHILKEYIRILQCKAVGTTCPTRSPDTDKTDTDKKDTKKEDTDKKDAGTDKPKAEGPPASEKKISEAISKANAKLMAARNSLVNAKSYLKNIKTAEERKVTKTKITQVLDDNKELKDVAGKIRAKEGEEFRTFVALVDDIYKLASGF